MRPKMWLVAMFVVGFVLGCSSERHGATQNPEGAPDGDVTNDASGDAGPARCAASGKAAPVRRDDPSTCAATTGAPGLTDQCTTDDQCAGGTACGCASDFFGNALHTNTCVDAQCRVDSDCGVGNVCSPSFSGHCGSLTGYFCHSSADECLASGDCCADPARPTCQYSTQLGHWACQAVIVCNG
jgi:hypothetical protein